MLLGSTRPGCLSSKGSGSCLKYFSVSLSINSAILKMNKQHRSPNFCSGKTYEPHNVGNVTQKYRILPSYGRNGVPILRVLFRAPNCENIRQFLDTLCASGMFLWSLSNLLCAPSHSTQHLLLELRFSLVRNKNSRQINRKF